MIIDNAENPRKIVAEKDEGGIIIYNQLTYKTIKNYGESR